MTNFLNLIAWIGGELKDLVKGEHLTVVLGRRIASGPEMWMNFAPPDTFSADRNTIGDRSYRAFTSGNISLIDGIDRYYTLDTASRVSELVSA